MSTFVSMTDYIYETPNIIEKNLLKHDELCRDLVALFTRKTYKRIIFLASGSSFTAIHCAKTYLKEHLQIDVTILTPYTFTHYDYKYLKDSDFVIVTTQSGSSINCIEALKCLHKHHHDTIVLTGNIHSDCKDYTDYIFDWGCGLESVGYVTLGVVSLIVYLQIFAVHCAKILHRDELSIAHCISQIRKAMKNHIEMCIKSESFIKQHLKELMQMDRVYILGCGSNYGTALEGALKIGETIKVLAVAYELDEFLHGPALQITPRYHIFIIDSHDETSAYARKVHTSLSLISNHVYLLGNDSNDVNAITLGTPCEEPFTCLYYLPYFQLIAERISTLLNSKRSHPLYYEMNKTIDFRTVEFRKHTPAEDD